MSHPLPPPATDPHSQAILLDQPFGEEFLHTLVHTSSEPIPFLKQGWGHLGDIGRLGVRTENWLSPHPHFFPVTWPEYIPKLGCCLYRAGVLSSLLPQYTRPVHTRSCYTEDAIP